MWTMVLSWLKALTPRNIVIGLVGVLILGLSLNCWRLQGGLTKTKTDLATSQRSLAAVNVALDTCVKNVGAVNVQYREAAKTTLTTTEIKDRIVKVREWAPCENVTITGVSTILSSKGTPSAPPITSKEPGHETKYLVEIISISNALANRFNGVQSKGADTPG